MHKISFWSFDNSLNIWTFSINYRFDFNSYSLINYISFKKSFFANPYKRRSFLLKIKKKKPVNAKIEADRGASKSSAKSPKTSPFFKMCFCSLLIIT